jgi:hypothetical protein
MAEGIFVTAINCMDGRMQLPINEFMKQKYNADFVDTITEPGPNKILAENLDVQIVASIRRRADISVEKHGSKVVAIVGHFDCGGNPVSKETQMNQLDDAVRIVESWDFDVEIIKLWVDENWCVQLV